LRLVRNQFVFQVSIKVTPKLYRRRCENRNFSLQIRTLNSTMLSTDFPNQFLWLSLMLSLNRYHCGM
jgi:hypothetical protein